ncbi:DUF6790 family protein [Blastopirellula marina]|uniref:Uncharacterized protein n=1 Tax=Blastopirellula marina DSM 3645 TaxID=314230 RepID=A3ZQY5_9BACT|nr:DUF6790 family protein [Blastopirellula marina]EAQ81078.1 hypothetical protein DSM3645_20942 [Blastopirellula marina DSM 3645]
MLAAIIQWVLSNYAVTFFLIGLFCSAASLAVHRQTLTQHRVFEALLAYYCLCGVGLFYIYNFVMHVFFGEIAAKFIGWADSPFQLEVGFASLGFGVVGLLAFQKDFGLRLAANVGPACFMWGAAAGHIYQMVARHNFAPGNAGVMFWADIFLPAIGFFFLIGWSCSSPDLPTPPDADAPA